MSNVQEVWWRSGGRSPFALDPTKPRLPQIGSMVGQFLIIFGGPAIGLITIKYYPFLIEDRTIYIGGVASILFWFLASFAMFGSESFPRGNLSGCSSVPALVCASPVCCSVCSGSPTAMTCR